MIQYYGKAESGAVGNPGKNWVALDGEKVNGLTYPSIPAGKQKIRISWGGSRDFAPGSVTVSVAVTDNRINSKVVLKSETSFTYSSTTTPPTEPGHYTMTVVVLGGNYLASPINRSFQISK